MDDHGRNRKMHDGVFAPRQHTAPIELAPPLPVSHLLP